MLIRICRLLRSRSSKKGEARKDRQYHGVALPNNWHSSRTSWAKVGVFGQRQITRAWVPDSVARGSFVGLLFRKKFFAPLEYGDSMVALHGPEVAIETPSYASCAVGL